MNPELRRYLPFVVAVLLVLALAALSFGAGYRLGLSTHRVQHARPSSQSR